MYNHFQNQRFSEPRPQRYPAKYPRTAGICVLSRTEPPGLSYQYEFEVAMKYEIVNQDSFPMLQVHLEQGEKISCERGAMITMSQGLELQGDVKGGIVGGLIRSFLTQESFFTENITASGGAGTASIGAGIPGSILALEVTPSKTLLVQKGGYLASTPGVEIGTKMQGLIKGFTSKEGFFLITLTGSGTAFIASLGAAHRFDLEPGEELVVDNGHLLAWDETLEYTMQKASGFVSSVTSGEGLVCKFRGPGTLYIHTMKY